MTWYLTVDFPLARAAEDLAEQLESLKTAMFDLLAGMYALEGAVRMAESLADEPAHYERLAFPPGIFGPGLEILALTDEGSEFISAEEYERRTGEKWE